MFAVYAAEGRPDDPLSALKIGERPRPEVPAKHVAVNVRAASLNMHDLWTLRGVGISSHMFPMTLGMDGAGVTDDGREVVIHSVIPSTGWQGDETLDPHRSILSERYQGTFADRVIVPESNILPKPPAMSFNEAACMGFYLQLRIIGSTMGTRNELADLLTLCTDARIHPQISCELPMDEADKAFRLMMDGQTAGKIVLTRP